MMANTKTEQVLLDPYRYICQIPGKQVRTQLAKAFNYWLKIPDDKIQIISEATQMLHNASLLIDDIEDNSQLRRGIPVAHNIFGVAHTINSANYVYFLGLQKILTLEVPEATKVFTDHILELHEGQGMDIYYRDSFVCPSEEEYKDMVAKKTGGLFGLAVGLMQLFSENKCDLKPLINALGLYFQIRDDYANLNSKEYEANKSYCEDLTEGKFSFPIIHAIKCKPDDSQVMSILRQRTKDNAVKKYCVDYMEKIGTFEYTKRVLIEYEELCLSLIEGLGGNPHLVGLIDNLKQMYRNDEKPHLKRAEKSPEKRREQSSFWPPTNTRLLLEMYKDRKEQFESPLIKKKKIWNEITLEINRRTNNEYIRAQVEGRWKTLLAAYRKFKNNNDDSKRNFDFLYEIEEIVGDQYNSSKNVNLGDPITSTENVLCPVSSENGSVLDNSAAITVSITSMLAQDHAVHEHQTVGTEGKRKHTNTDDIEKRLNVTLEDQNTSTKNVLCPVTIENVSNLDKGASVFDSVASMLALGQPVYIKQTEVNPEGKRKHKNSGDVEKRRKNDSGDSQVVYMDGVYTLSKPK